MLVYVIEIRSPEILKTSAKHFHVVVRDHSEEAAVKTVARKLLIPIELVVGCRVAENQDVFSAEKPFQPRVI